MTTKLIEIRDAGTFIPAIAIRLDPTNDQDSYLLSRAGYGHDPGIYILFARLFGGACEYDPMSWGNRTMQVAHEWVWHNWRKITSGQVVDVQYILGETSEPKLSERLAKFP